MRWPEINLAPIKYAKVHKDYGGPIERISSREITLFGKPAYEAFAYLDEKVAGKGEKHSVLYGNSDGSGTAYTQAGAVYAAISEALERWAWRATLHSGSANQLGYDIDPSTNGFAAFPGLFKSSCRHRARNETIERWSVAAWWEKKLSHSNIDSFLLPSDVTGIQLKPIFGGACTVILKSPTAAFSAYSFATADSISDAVRRALIELDRNKKTVPIYFDSKDKLQIKNLTEKRLIFFASGEGHDRFQKRLETLNVNEATVPKLVIDTEVEGPWSSFTHIWRCVLDRSEIHETQENDYFLF